MVTPHSDNNGRVKPHNRPLPKGMKPFTPGARAAECGRKGGRANKGNPKCIIAAKLRMLKRKGMNEETAKRLYEIMTEHKLSALDIRIFLESIKREATTARTKTELAKGMIEWHKMTHGQIMKNENLNINVNVPIEEWERRLMQDDTND